MSERHGEQVQFDALFIQSDDDLWRKGKDETGGRRQRPESVCKQLFAGLKAEFAEYAKDPTIPKLRVSRADTEGIVSPGELLAKEDHFIVFASPSGTWVGFQYQEDALCVPRHLIKRLRLFRGTPTARGRGGFTFECELTEKGAYGSHRSVRVDLSYHLSDAGAYRLLAATVAMGAFFSCPVGLEEYSDC